MLAHEMGHYKLGHVPKRLAWSALTLLAGFWVIAWLLRRRSSPQRSGSPRVGSCAHLAALRTPQRSGVLLALP